MGNSEELKAARLVYFKKRAELVQSTGRSLLS
jgi:hypothetical protein